MIGIYKIENIKNHKKYIGQSSNILQRWNHHKQESSNENSNSYEYPLYRAFRKYGLENFTFEVIEECDINILDEREIYWIKYYDSFFNGYNQTLGGRCSRRINKENIIKIFKLLKETDLTQKEIAQQCNISEEMVQGINTGRYWNTGEKYPIRERKSKSQNKTKNKDKNKVKHYIKEMKCIDCGKPISNNAKRCTDCENKHRVNENNKQMKVSKEELNELIHKYPFTKIGEMFGVSDNAIRKWCKQYNLPYKYRDLYPQEKVDKEKRISYDDFIVEMSNKQLFIEFENINKAIDYLIDNGYTKENISRKGIRDNISNAYRNNKTYLSFKWNLIKRI